ERLPEVEDRLRAIEPDAPIIRAARGQVDPALFFPPEPGAVDRSGKPPAASPHDHESFETRVELVAAGIPAAELESSLRRPDLVRAKGFVETADGLRLVQVVGRRVELTEVEVAPDPSLVGRLLLISRARIT
ncbi:MAG: hypothetical protein O7A09_03105, partial [Proteobacteria bacterium]|nr:hypothetical protein [Pseudomonadota bacterium]